MADLRPVAAPFVALGPSGVAIRTSLKGLTAADEAVLRQVGAHLGALAARDLKQRCADALEHSAQTWAERKRAVTGESSSRWAGSITKASHDQWALSRRAQLAHIQNLEAGVRTIAHRLLLPVGGKLISGMPVSKLRARLVSMAAELGITIIAVDPAYTSRWGAEHWQKPLTSTTRKTTRHDAAAVAIARRALGHPIRRRTTPPPQHQSDTAGHRTAQAGPGNQGREGTRHRIPGPRTRCAQPDAERTREPRTSTTVRDVPDGQE